MKPFIKVTISLYRIPFIKGIEILYKGLAFPQKFVNFYSVELLTKVFEMKGNESEHKYNRLVSNPGPQGWYASTILFDIKSQGKYIGSL